MLATLTAGALAVAAIGAAAAAQAFASQGLRADSASLLSLRSNSLCRRHHTALHSPAWPLSGSGGPAVALAGKGSDNEGGKETKGDPYKQFLEVARQEGVDEALLFASEQMPKDFCRYLPEMRAAAEFVRSRAARAAAPPRSPGSATLEEAPQTQMPRPPPMAPAPVLASMPGSTSGSAGANGQGAVVLKVCEKCVNRLKKKGDDMAFDPSSALLAHFGAGGLGEVVRVESTGCMKQCKMGPNVQVVPATGSGGEPVAIDGMTDQECQAKCFHRVVNAAAAQRVHDLVQSALPRRTPPVNGAVANQVAAASVGDFAEGPAALDVNAAAAATAAAAAAQPNSEFEVAALQRERRGRLRDSYRARIADIVGDLVDLGPSRAKFLEDSL